MSLIKFCFILLLNLLVNSVNADYIIKQDSRIIDMAQVLTKEQIKILSSKLSTIHEGADRVNVQILLLPSLYSGDLDGFMQEVSHKLLSQENFDNNILILIITNTGKYRIDVDSQLTDYQSDIYSLLDEQTHLNYYFKKHEYYVGLVRLVDTLSQKLMAYNGKYKRYDSTTIMVLIIKIVAILLFTMLIYYLYYYFKQHHKKK